MLPIRSRYDQLIGENIRSCSMSYIGVSEKRKREIEVRQGATEAVAAVVATT